MKKNLFFILFCFFTCNAYSQSVSYTYDNAGNRIKRQQVTTRSLSKEMAEDAKNSSPEKKELLWTATVSPVPTEGEFTITFKNIKDDFECKLYLYSIAGVCIEEKKTKEAKVSFDITGSPSGVYLLKAVTQEKTQSWKVIRK